MAGFDLLTKTLRAILQMNRGRMSLHRLKSEYKLLTGEHMAYREMGHNSLLSLLSSMSSIMYMERNRFGEIMCFASAVNEMTPTVSKETGRPHLANSTRVKAAAPRVINAKPQTPLRRHNYRDCDVFFTMPRDVRVVDLEAKNGTRPYRSTKPLSENPPSSPAALSLDLKLKELLLKYPHGLWAKALPQVFQDNYKTKLPAYLLENLHLLDEFCDVVCPLPGDTKKVILYIRIPSQGATGGD